MSVIDVEEFSRMFGELEDIVHSDMTPDQKHEAIFYSGLSADICKAGLIDISDINSCNLVEIDLFYDKCRRKMSWLLGVGRK